MARSIDISINTKPGTNYFLKSSEGDFNPPLPSSISDSPLVQSRCTSPASFAYGGSCADVTFAVGAGAVLVFSFSGMDSANIVMLEAGDEYKAGFTLAVS